MCQETEARMGKRKKVRLFSTYLSHCETKYAFEVSFLNLYLHVLP